VRNEEGRRETRGVGMGGKGRSVEGEGGEREERRWNEAVGEWGGQNKEGAGRKEEAIGKGRDGEMKGGGKSGDEGMGRVEGKRGGVSRE